MKNRFSQKALVSLQKVVDAFERGDVAQTLARATFRMPDVPSARWSMSNRWLAYIQTTDVDCRGLRQWEAAGRQIKKGELAAFIFRPRKVKVRVEEDGVEKEKILVTGYSTLPIFGVSQTSGAPLNYAEPEVPDLPLMEVAKHWGLEVVARPFVGKAFGSYSPGTKKITLHCADEDIFFHELVHVAHERLKGKLNLRQCPLQEVIAELGACCLRELVGHQSMLLGNHFQYIQHYAQKREKSVLDGCLEVLIETSQVISLILEAAEEIGVEVGESIMDC